MMIHMKPAKTKLFIALNQVTSPVAQVVEGLILLLHQQ
jgi:hypothetical protein